MNDQTNQMSIKIKYLERENKNLSDELKTTKKLNLSLQNFRVVLDEIRRNLNKSENNDDDKNKEIM